MAPAPAAGKADSLKSPPKLEKKGEDTKDQAAKSVSEGSESIEENTKKVSQPGDSKTDLGDVEPTPIDEAGEAGDEAGDAVAGAEDKGKEAAEEAEATTDDATEKTGDTADDATEKAGDTADDAEEAASAQEPEKKDEEGAADTAKGLAGKAGDLAGKGTDDIKEMISGLTNQQSPEAAGFELLKGLSPDEKGNIKDSKGNTVGRLVEGDAEDLVGYEIGDDGEILDDDGDLVGRCEVLPETIQKLKDNLPLDAKLPDISVLKGLTVDATGQILNDDGDTIGQLIEGNPSELAGREINEKGEILDDDGNVIGRARVHPDAAGLVGQAEDKAEEAGDAVGEAGETAEGAVDAAKDEVPENIEAELPGVEALEGKEINSQGEILDEDGEVIGKLAEGNVEDVKGLTVNENGEVVDADGNVLGKVELAEGAAEKLRDISSLLDIRILEGLKVNKKGKVLDEEGEEIGQLTEGDPKKVAGKTINDKGEVLDKDGSVIGKVEVVSGDAATEAMKALKERLAEAGEPLPGEEIIPDLKILEGLKVNKKGQILNEDGEPIGELVEGELSDCAGKKVNDKGEVLDKDGNVIGKVKALPQQAEEAAEETGEAAEEAAEEAGDQLPPLSILEGLKVNKAGKLIDKNGTIVGELVEGDAKKLSKSGATCDAEGQFWDNKGHIIGRAKTIQTEDNEEDAPFAGLEGLIVVKGGYVEDENGNRVGVITEGDAKKLVGRAVDEDGDIIDKKGSVVGHAERYEEAEEAEAEPIDNSILAGKALNKQGFVVDEDGIPIGRLVEGNVKDLAGRKCDEEGLIHNDTGKVVGRCEVIPESERSAKKEGPFAGYEGLKVNQDGKVEDIDGNVVGILVDGNPKKLVGHSVDEDGDIIDKYGNVKGHAEPWEPEEEKETDLSLLAGGTVNKAGNVVSPSGQVVGRVSEGDLKNLIGKKVDGKGQIWDNEGNVIGKAELVQGADNTPDGPFAGFDNLEIKKDGTVQTQSGDIVGRIIEGDIKKLMGHRVDEDGDIVDKNGNAIGKAERWEPEEKERKVNPMAGRRVNKQGEVVDENGDVIGRLTAGDLGHCVGLEIDDNGYVVDNDGNKVGEVTLLENIQDDHEEETDEEKQKKQDAELADKMSNICQQTLERIQPVLKQITEYIEKADRTPRDELDEEELVNNVKPLIEEGGRILQECNGSLRGLDPDGRIAAQAKGRSKTREATPEEYRLADLLKELTSTVVTTIDNAKKRISDMPHAKKKLNPLWALLTEPLFQIIAAVGLLLSGVLGLVGRLLNALGLGGLVNGLLGGLGIDKLLGGLGLGSLSESLGLGGKKKGKKGGGASNIPLVGGLLGGGDK